MDLQRYEEHCSNAKCRGIPFLLTFEEWSAIWETSGKWSQRGWRKGQYVMARYGDQGAYETGNVRICLAEENRAERNYNYPMLGEMNPAYGQNYVLGHTSEERERISAIISEKNKGIPKPEHMREALARTATGRRRVYRAGRRTWAYPGDVDYPR